MFLYTKAEAKGQVPDFGRGGGGNFLWGGFFTQKVGNLTPRPPLQEWRGGARDLVAGVARGRGIRDPGGVEAGVLSRSRVRSPYGTGVLDCGPGAGGCWVLEDGIF